MYYNTEECNKLDNFFSPSKAFFLMATKCMHLLCQSLHPSACDRSLHKGSTSENTRFLCLLSKPPEHRREPAIYVQKCCAESSVATCSAWLAKQHARLALRIPSSASCPARSSSTQGESVRWAAPAGGCPRAQGNAAEPQEVPAAVHWKARRLSGTESLLVVMDCGP